MDELGLHSEWVVYQEKRLAERGRNGRFKKNHDDDEYNVHNF